MGTGRTQPLGLTLADITNATFCDVLRATQSMVVERSYTKMIAESAESPDAELGAALRMQGTADGLTLASPRMQDDSGRMLDATKPVIVVNRDVKGVSCVTPDVTSGIHAAVTMLEQQGHRRIAFVAGP